MRSEQLRCCSTNSLVDTTRRHSALALGSSLFASNVSNMWLSPQQTALEGVMEGVDKVDGILKNLQHVTAIAKGEHRHLEKQHKALKDKHDHLAEWNQRETIRKSGMKSVGEQFNSNLREPKNTSVQSDVTWLARVPQMRDGATGGSGGKEKVMYAMTTSWDKAKEDGLMKGKIGGGRGGGGGEGGGGGRADGGEGGDKFESEPPTMKRGHATGGGGGGGKVEVGAGTKRRITSVNPVALSTSPKNKEVGGVSPTSPRKWGGSTKDRSSTRIGFAGRKSMLMKAAVGGMAGAGAGGGRSLKASGKSPSPRRQTTFFG